VGQFPAGQLGQFLSGRSTSFEADLECSFPPALRRLYLAYAGQERRARHGLRLLSLPEALADWKEVKRCEAHAVRALERVRPVLTNDDGLYAAVHVVGDLAGYVCVIDYHDIDISPRFTSLDTMASALAEADERGLDWDEATDELPRTTSSPSDLQTLGAARALMSEANGTQDVRFRCHLLLCAVQILPVGHADTLRTLAADLDPWVRERACEVAGKQSVREMVPTLLALAKAGAHNNDRIASILALQSIPGAEALAATKELRESLGDSCQVYFHSAGPDQYKKL
jgi:hypothetical protein